MKPSRCRQPYCTRESKLVASVPFKDGWKRAEPAAPACSRQLFCFRGQDKELVVGNLRLGHVYRVFLVAESRLHVCCSMQEVQRAIYVWRKWLEVEEHWRVPASSTSMSRRMTKADIIRRHDCDCGEYVHDGTAFDRTVRRSGNIIKELMTRAQAGETSTISRRS